MRCFYQVRLFKFFHYNSKISNPGKNVFFIEAQIWANLLSTSILKNDSAANSKLASSSLESKAYCGCKGCPNNFDLSIIGKPQITSVNELISFDFS